MNGRSFLSEFLKTFHAKAILPGGLSPRGLQDVAELIFLLDKEIDPHRVQASFVDAITHLKHAPEHAGRSLPGRLTGLLSNPPVKPELLANSLAKACSCDYLEWPRPEDWHRDEHLYSAVSCSVLETMFGILPVAEYVRNAIRGFPFSPRLSPRQSGVIFLSQAIDDYRTITAKVPELVGRPKSYQVFGARLFGNVSAKEADKLIFALKVLLLTAGNEKRSDEDLAMQIHRLEPIPEGAMN